VATDASGCVLIALIPETSRKRKSMAGRGEVLEEASQKFSEYCPFHRWSSRQGPVDLFPDKEDLLIV
jgi:hypothetical protein